MHVSAAPKARARPRPRGVPLTGDSDVTFRLPTRLQVRLAAESLLSGRAADELAAEAIEVWLAAKAAGREIN